MCQLPLDTMYMSYYDRLQGLDKEITDMYVARFPELKDQMDAPDLHTWGIEQCAIREALPKFKKDVEDLLARCKTAEEFRDEFWLLRADLPKNNINW